MLYGFRASLWLWMPPSVWQLMLDGHRTSLDLSSSLCARCRSLLGQDQEVDLEAGGHRPHVSDGGPRGLRGSHKDGGMSDRSAGIDFLNADELGRLNVATSLILHGTKVLVSINSSGCKARWSATPKLHHIFHIIEDSQSSHRPTRAFLSWLDEENMGKLAKVAGSAHASTLSFRALDKWCMQFFNFLND